MPLPPILPELPAISEADCRKSEPEFSEGWVHPARPADCDRAGSPLESDRSDDPTCTPWRVTMTDRTDRRDFLKRSLAVAGGLTLTPSLFAQEEKDEKEPLYRISLAEWSLHKALFGGK